LKWNHNTILGITDKVTVKPDFDDTPFKTVRHRAERAYSWFRLDGFDIFKSSKNHYHVVFDRRVTWKTNIRVMCWVAMLSQIGKLKDYVLMQGIKESSTLRVGPKGDKPSPRIVNRFGEQDGEIQNFLKKRKEIKDTVRRMDCLIATEKGSPQAMHKTGVLQSVEQPSKRVQEISLLLSSHHDRK